MTKLAALFAFAVIFCLPAMAQGTPQFEIGGGYAFRSYDESQSGTRLKMNGWDAFGDYHIWRFINVAADFSGTYNHYGSSTNVYTNDGNTAIYNALIGPQLYPFGHRHKYTLFGHFLFGGGLYVYNLPPQGGYSAVHTTDSAMSWMGGGGLDVRINKHWSARLPQADYEQTRFFGGNPSQGNYRISVGVVYRFHQK